jgi:PilZ domain
MLAETEKSRMEAGLERRMMRRFDMRLPASIRVRELGSEPFMTETQNVSARGVFFYLDRPIKEGSHIEVTMTFPPHITLTDPVRVRFMARVVRVNAPLPASRVGVAAIIEEYEFLRTYSESNEVSH